MRDYATVTPKFWIGDTGKALRGNRNAQILALYLMTCPHSNMLGVYYLPLPTIAHETGITTEAPSKPLQSPFEGVLEAFRTLSDANFAYYDEHQEVVFIPNMAAFQIAGKLNPGDNRVKGIIRELEKYKKTKFYNMFLEIYQEKFHLPEGLKIDVTTEAPSKPLQSPFEGPCKPLRSQEQEQEQEQEQDQELKEKRILTDSQKEKVNGNLGCKQKSLHGVDSANSLDSKQPRTAKATLEKPDDLTGQTWTDWQKHRKEKRAPVTQTVIDQFRLEATKAGITLEEAVKLSCAQGWQGFKSDWAHSGQNGNGSAPLGQCPKRFHPPGSTKLKTCGKPGVELVGKYAFCQDHLQEAQKGALSHG
jgi:hypothetical protein